MRAARLPPPLPSSRRSPYALVTCPLLSHHLFTNTVFLLVLFMSVSVRFLTSFHRFPYPRFYAIIFIFHSVRPWPSARSRLIRMIILTILYYRYKWLFLHLIILFYPICLIFKYDLSWEGLSSSFILSIIVVEWFFFFIRSVLSSSMICCGSSWLSKNKCVSTESIVYLDFKEGRNNILKNLYNSMKKR